MFFVRNAGVKRKLLSDLASEVLSFEMNHFIKGCFAKIFKEGAKAKDGWEMKNEYLDLNS